MAKRLFDLMFSISFIVFFPLFIVVYFAVFVFIGSPVFFVQQRPGLNSKLFKLYKFRTMREIFDHSGNPLPDSERLGSFGRFLRSTSLDELPSIYNVLIGEMSVVGPRPLLVEYLPLYTKFQSRRHDVRPGLTGWAQINGRNALSWEEKFEMDVWYVENRTLWLDLKIVLLTVKKVLVREGISAAGEATMTRFTGSTNKGVK